MKTGLSHNSGLWVTLVLFSGPVEFMVFFLAIPTSQKAWIKNTK